MRKILVVAVVIVAMAMISAIAAIPVQAGQAGRDNTRFAYQLGCGYRDAIDCAAVWASRLGTLSGGNSGVNQRIIVINNSGGGDFVSAGGSAGEEAAFRQGQADALAELQRERENNAYNLGRGSIGRFSSGNFGGFSSGSSSCYGDCSFSPFSLNPSKWR